MMTPFQSILFFLLLASIGNVNGIYCPDKCFSMDAKTCFLNNECFLNHCCGHLPLNNGCDICALEKGCEKDPKAQFCVSHNCCK